MELFENSSLISYAILVKYTKSTFQLVRIVFLNLSCLYVIDLSSSAKDLFKINKCLSKQL